MLLSYRSLIAIICLVPALTWGQDTPSLDKQPQTTGWPERVYQLTSTPTGAHYLQAGDFPRVAVCPEPEQPLMRVSHGREMRGTPGVGI